ncbi:hypothetical protein QR680_001837 [Steinernema hermaphroditum]|uniref:Regulatory protein SIR2 homolog 7 n=1 Tax=Steinernema hermaphroditum TaxID=289476 RepID=A0AA39H0X9_9BILA|nr:hypothetical protein QR680_001837 [Steinernema hermaphroditum]
MEKPVIALDLEDACERLVQLMRSSKGILCYTGAGVSTSANLPDYRGPNGVLRTAQMGRVIKLNNPATCDPTQTHLCIREFCYNKIFKHVLSQNCDGLHLRSGIPQKMLSEIHGNMHIEVCLNCEYLQYFRPTDVNPNSSINNHETERQCSNCKSSLYDTIVQRGEEGFLPYPNNWRGIFEKLDDCDLIVVINIAPTKKDKDAVLVIREECDKVFVKVAEAFDLDIRHYCRSCDPVLNLRTSRRAYFMTNYTFCKCHIRAPRTSSHRTATISNGIPGFMMGGLPVSVQKTFWVQNGTETQENVTTLENGKRKRGRPRKTSIEIKDEVKAKRPVGRPRKTVARKVKHTATEESSQLNGLHKTATEEHTDELPSTLNEKAEDLLYPDDIVECISDLIFEVCSKID